MSFSFQVIARCAQTEARAGMMHTPHGAFATPAFMPVATQGTVKSLTPQQVRETGATILLSNTYHLYLRPGAEIIEQMGGLHRFMGWDGPILTDSGGFQVLSLAHLRSIDDTGVTFRSHIDGSPHVLTPEKAITIQEKLGADIIMTLDECPPYPASEEHHRQAMMRTHQWAQRCLAAHQKDDQALFGIVQGGTFPALRRESAQFMDSLGLPGYGIGGLSLGESKEITQVMLEETVAWLPSLKPRYMMGVGSPEDIFECVARGVDLFDSVLPTRVARNGALFTREGRINIRNARYRERESPLEDSCKCYTCRSFSAAYVQHLFKAEELLAYSLATIHNLWFIIHLMEDIRAAIVGGAFPSFRREFLSHYKAPDQEVQREQKRRWLKSHGR